MTETKLRVGLLGCGRVAQHYVKILNGDPGVTGLEIVGCADARSQAATATANALNSTAFASLDAMIDGAKPDLVLVLTPSGDHTVHARDALEKGCHVICEKPITLLPGDAYDLAELAASKGLMYGCIFQNRYNPAVMKLKETFAEGRFGRIISACVRLRWCREQSYYEDEWHGTWAMDGGVINQQAIHHVDALNWICGPVERVSAAMANRMNELEAEDTMVAALQFSNGALGTIEATTAARPRDFEASLSIVGEKGMAQIGGIALNTIDTWEFTESRPSDHTVFEEFSRSVPTGYGLSHGPMLQDIADRLLSGDIQPPITALDAVRSVELVHALYKSIESETWVNIGDQPLSSRLGAGIANDKGDT
ncbi:Gfo/Idh/MocA family oxidoreductase [Roseibium sp. HPY-6]|uniref:Gfo/Idh/MocA family protein n=1 Tax=Roseibium sp. HPY-6 TaxID=3229852 RepID=UPI0033903751